MSAPITLKAESAQILLDHVGVPVGDAIRNVQTLMPGGAKLHYRMPQRTWLLYGYSHDGRDVLRCAKIIAFGMPDKAARC